MTVVCFPIIFVLGTEMYNTSIAQSTTNCDRPFITHCTLFTALSLKCVSNAVILVSLVLVKLAAQNCQIFYIIAGSK